jgi:D-alanyl-D-alanine carboxypeptidase/D-alanyl-D-alanine-endopeptidase (penicillin-binding protein 4)
VIQLSRPPAPGPAMALVLLLAASALAAQPAGVGGAPPTEFTAVPTASVVRLRARLDDLLSRAPFRRAHVGLIVHVAETGEVLYELVSGKRFTPGSTVKLVTAGVALEVLGAAYRWQTRVLASGPVVEGRLEGDVWIMGSGDPTLSREEITGIIEFLRLRGIREIDGDVVADDRAFEEAPWGRGWMWDDLHVSFSGGVSGFQLDPNDVPVRLIAGSRVGEPALLQYLKPGPRLPILLDVLTGPAGSDLELQVLPLPGGDAGERRIIGQLPLGRSFELSFAPAHPTLYALSYVGSVLADSGIAVGGQLRRAERGERKPPASAILGEITSDSLGLVLREFLKPSDNQIGESILRTIGREAANEGSSEAGLKVVERILYRWGIDPAATELADGSGLSRYNQISPRALNRLLMVFWHHPERETLIDALPIAGVDGTLEWRMRGTAAENNARAKTGSLEAVRALSGYVRSRDGQTLIFTLLVNGYEGPGSAARAVEDLIVEQLALFRRDPG